MTDTTKSVERNTEAETKNAESGTETVDGTAAQSAVSALSNWEWAMMGRLLYQINQPTFTLASGPTGMVKGKSALLKALSDQHELVDVHDKDKTWSEIMPADPSTLAPATIEACKKVKAAEAQYLQFCEFPTKSYGSKSRIVDLATHVFRKDESLEEPATTIPPDNAKIIMLDEVNKTLIGKSKHRTVIPALYQALYEHAEMGILGQGKPVHDATATPTESKTDVARAVEMSADKIDQADKADEEDDDEDGDHLPELVEIETQAGAQETKAGAQETKAPDDDDPQPCLSLFSA